MVFPSSVGVFLEPDPPGGSITGCCASCVVQAVGDSGGGLVGNSYGYTAQFVPVHEAIVSNCYSIVLGGSRVSGLLIGDVGREENPHWPYYPSFVINCYAACRGPEVVEALGFVGKNYSRASNLETVIDCFWVVHICGLTDNLEGGLSKLMPEMQTASTFLEAGWDFIDESDNGTEDIWWIDEGKDYPKLWWEMTGGN